MSEDTKAPKLKFRVVLLVLSVVMLVAGLNIYAAVKSSLDASIAVQQLNDSVVTYSLVQKIIYRDFIPKVWAGMFILFNIVVFWKPFRYHTKP